MNVYEVGCMHMSNFSYRTVQLCITFCDDINNQAGEICYIVYFACGSVTCRTDLHFQEQYILYNNIK